MARKKMSLLATELGFVVCNFLVAQFPDLFAAGSAAQMEEDLDRIARGERVWVEVLREFYGPFAAAVTQAQGGAATEPVTVSGGNGQAMPAPETCPECGAEVVVREGKYGRFRACTRFPRCKWSAPLVVDQCPACGTDLVERKGKRGAFWGCSRYPACRYTQEPQAETVEPPHEEGDRPPQTRENEAPSG